MILFYIRKRLRRRQNYFQVLLSIFLSDDKKSVGVAVALSYAALFNIGNDRFSQKSTGLFIYYSVRQLHLII